MAMTHDRGEKKKTKLVFSNGITSGDYELLIGVIVITRKVAGMSKNSGKMNTTDHGLSKGLRRENVMMKR